MARRIGTTDADRIAASAQEAAWSVARQQRLLLVPIALTSTVWLAIGVYSGVATYRGFVRLNWGNLALVLD